jgi:hypothetical protein
MVEWYVPSPYKTPSIYAYKMKFTDPSIGRDVAHNRPNPHRHIPLLLRHPHPPRPRNRRRISHTPRFAKRRVHANHPHPVHPRARPHQTERRIFIPTHLLDIPYLQHIFHLPHRPNHRLGAVVPRRKYLPVWNASSGCMDECEDDNEILR